MPSCTTSTYLFSATPMARCAFSSHACGTRARWPGVSSGMAWPSSRGSSLCSSAATRDPQARADAPAANLIAQPFQDTYLPIACQ